MRRLLQPVLLAALVPASVCGARPPLPGPPVALLHSHLVGTWSGMRFNRDTPPTWDRLPVRLAVTEDTRHRRLLFDYDFPDTPREHERFTMRFVPADAAVVVDWNTGSLWNPLTRSLPYVYAAEGLDELAHTGYGHFAMVGNASVGKQAPALYRNAYELRPTSLRHTTYLVVGGQPSRPLVEEVLVRDSLATP